MISILEASITRPPPLRTRPSAARLHFRSAVITGSQLVRRRSRGRNTRLRFARSFVKEKERRARARTVDPNYASPRTARCRRDNGILRVFALSKFLVVPRATRCATKGSRRVGISHGGRGDMPSSFTMRTVAPVELHERQSLRY